RTGWTLRGSVSSTQSARRQKRFPPRIIVALSVLAMLSHPLSARQTPDPAVTAAKRAEAGRALLDRYCVTCHNARNRSNAGQLDLTSVDLANPSQHADIFEKVVAKLRAGLMPPAGQRRPEPADRIRLVRYLEAELDRSADRSPDPGRTEAFHRLNR